MKSVCGFMKSIILEEEHHSAHYFEFASMNASALLESRGHFVLFRCAETTVGLSLYRSKLEARLPFFPFLYESCYLGANLVVDIALHRLLVLCQILPLLPASLVKRLRRSLGGEKAVGFKKQGFEIKVDLVSYCTELNNYIVCSVFFASLRHPQMIPDFQGSQKISPSFSLTITVDALD